MPAPKDLIKKEIWQERLRRLHKGLTPWNKGKHLSEETKRKVGEKMKELWKSPKYKGKMEIRNKKTSKAMKGDKNPMKKPEVREKRSEKMKGKLVGDKNPAKRLEARREISKSLTGHLVLPEIRAKIRETLKGKYIAEKNPFYGKHHTKEIKEKSRLRAIRQLVSGEIGKRNTSIELKIEKELKKQNIGYEKQIPLMNITIADFYLPQYKIAIFCDGTFWHKSDWAKRNGVIEKDKRQNNLLEDNNYKVFRFDEIEINKSTERCVDMIIKYLNKS